MNDTTARRAWLPDDIARCAGHITDGELREGCDDCLRRTAPPGNPDRVLMMAPPEVIVFECHSRIEP